MKEKLALRIMSVILAVCLVVCSTSIVQIVRAYANEGGDLEINEAGEFNYEEGFNPDDDIIYPDQESDTDYDPDPTPDPEPDPFDYDLVCYTPNINFGTCYSDDIVNAKQFTIVNTGRNSFPLTWEEFDEDMAFDNGAITADLDLAPGESATFSVGPRFGLDSGKYVASYIFYSANDIRRHHTARVDVSITIKDNEPYVTEVKVIPGAVTIPAGKSYHFEAVVSGGYDYDPTVFWTVVDNISSGTIIDSDGNLAVSPDESGSFAVIAGSNQNSMVVGRAIVTVTSVDHVVSVKASPSEGGAVAGGGSVRDGDSMVISASPNNNYEFKGWYENDDCISTKGQLTLKNITEDRKIVAKFERKSCYVRTSVNNADGGTITESARVNYGGSMTRGCGRFLGLNCYS